ncbi:F-box only protein 8-like [Silene latifolia]|uniref:F-box only protein 8-like n=1 Tax=Silene latifolia TaxID=37657 RepID=UPI003D77A44B
MPAESEKSSKKAKSSSSNIRHSSKYLPLDVWASIIVNLPVKTLLRFRCVCKSWCSIIDHPDFAYTNLKLRKIDSKKSKIIALEGFGYQGGVLYQGARRCLLTVRQGDTLRKTAHIFESSDRYYLVGRCNELLLLKRFVYPGDFNPGYEKEMRLWNPSIRKSLLIPPCPLVNAIYLLGFAPCSKDYKIIAIDNNINRPKNYSYIAVYTLSNQQWCVRNNNDPQRIYVPPTAFYFQGAAHWFGKDPLVENQHQNELTHLVSFNFDLEKFTFLKIPRDSKGTDITRFLFILGESLAIFSVTQERSRIWVLEQGRSGKGVWTEWFSGRSNGDTYYLFSNSWSYSPLFYETDGERYFIIGKKSYNIDSGRGKELGKSMSGYLDLRMYMESLVLWKGYGAEDMASFP